MIQDSHEFSGEIVIDENLNGDYGPQWHFAVRPLEYTLTTKTGAHHEYVPLDPTKQGRRTKFGIILSSLLMTLGTTRPAAIGAGLLVGRQLMFLQKSFTFGKDRDTGEKIERDFMLFLRLFNAEDEARIASAGTLLATVPQGTYTDEEVAAIGAVVTGETDATVTAKAARSKLPQSLKAAVLSGTALPALLEQGKLLKSESGTYAIV